VRNDTIEPEKIIHNFFKEPVHPRQKLDGKGLVDDQSLRIFGSRKSNLIKLEDLADINNIDSPKNKIITFSGP